MISRQRLEFCRRGDSTVYRFDSCAPCDGYPSWKRTDLDLWLVRLPQIGWRIVDAHGVLLATPAENDAACALPPFGHCRSHKNGKCYDYDLIAAEAP